MPSKAAWAVLALAAAAVPAIAEYDVRVDLKNVSGEVKTDWPVVLRIYTVLGRNLDPQTLKAERFHVYGPTGKEIPHMIVKLPPEDVLGNDELVFVIPRMLPGQVQSYRITNISAGSRKLAAIHLVSSAHNLIGGGGFEDERGKLMFSPPARRDPAVARSGRQSLVLAADDQTVLTSYAKTIPLHKRSWYYLGIWSKTRTVSRFGYQARGGGYVRLTARDGETGKDLDAFAGQVTPQCSTRDWLKMTFEGGVTDWGMDRYTARAVQGQAKLELILRQPRHFYMDEGRTSGTWWLDDVVLMEQPEVRVRFDLALQRLVRDGAFLFTRPALTYLGKLDDKGRGEHEWCGLPYPHERLVKLDKFALKGQRVTYCVGVYHMREIPDVLCRVSGGKLTGPAGASLPLELVEYCPGYLGAGRDRYLRVIGAGDRVEPVTLAGQRGVRYFFLTFHVPRDARAGRYTGKVEILFEKTKPYRVVPITLRVQDMVQPVPKDVFVGMIFQGSDPPFNAEGLEVYSRSGFTSLTRFGRFLAYEKDASGRWRVDLDKLDKTMRWLKGYGLTCVCVFSDFDLGPKWNGGALLKRTRPADFNQGKRSWGDRLKTAKSAWQAQIRRIEAARKKHPDWPTLIYMTWDEPNLRGGGNGKPDPAMGWVNEVAPEALTTLDVQFAPLPVCIQWYRVPAFDDPANWAGPEVYRWVSRQGREFGFCGSAREEGESARYQPGMMMITTGAKYFHAWHLGRPQKMAGQMTLDKTSGRVVRAVSMINWADGMNDLKAYHLLRSAMAEARRSTDPKKLALASSAEEYLRRVLAVWNGDLKPTWPNEPYLGNTSDWGDERFYDRWQERMVRRAAALLGVEWVE